MEATLLEKFYRERSLLLCRYLMKLGCSSQDAEDIVQETFCKAIEFMPVLSTDNLSSWLFRVAINRWRDQCRKSKRNPQVCIDVLELTENLSNEADGEFLFLKKEDALKTKNVWNRLTNVHRNLLLLKYDMNLSYQKIGLLLDMNESTVKTYLYRARKAFQKEWRDEYER
ncbi:MAG: RNA polymerase sigma factor [Acetivibrio sp.]